MTITEYVAAYHAKPKPPKAEIVERWNTRVVPQGLHARGRAGAADYLARYGKGISAKKVSALALMAESEKAVDMAAAFWEEAYRLETGKFEPFCGGPGVKAAKPVNVPTAHKAKSVVLAGIPDEMQPGKIATMQPDDAPLPQSSYVLDPEYIGQPKRDGNRDVVFGTPTGVAHQSRSCLVMPTFSSKFDVAVQKAAKEIGAFVLDGEKLFLSVNGKEHRTAAQASTENLNLGQGTVRPVTKYSAFKALYFKDSLLERTEIERVKAGAVVVAAILRQGVGEVVLEATPTAYTTFEKTSLVSLQKAEGREGEVWTKRNCTYTGGKGHKTDTVRTKYLIEVEVIITDVVKSTADGRTVAAFVVSDLSGKPVGKVGSGFDEATGKKLMAAHKANSGTVRIPVIAQGWTENGRLCHARFNSRV